VREVARHGDEAVVRLGIDRDGNRPERRDEAVQELVALGLGRGDRRQEPRRTCEELGGGALRPARLGAADRVAADEARLARGRCADAALRRADVGDGAAGAARVEHRPYLCGQRRHGRRDEGEVRTCERRVQIGSALDSTASRGRLEVRRVGVPARDFLHPGSTRGEPDGRADQPGADDRQFHG
jgi:hypothetical protein